jgi:uncharacterized membrane protein
MNTNRSILVYIATLVFFVLTDRIWHDYFAFEFYQDQLSRLLRYHDGEYVPFLPAMAMMYPFMAGGILAFVLPKAIGEKSHTAAATWGGVFGLIVFASYQLTNYTILRRWPIEIVAVDTIWGIFLYSASSVFCYFVYNQLKPKKKRGRKKKVQTKI